MSRPGTGQYESEGTNMPPLVYETVAWLRFYCRLPVPPLPGESDPGAAPDPARTGYAAPIAGAVIGAVGGLVIVLAVALGASDFLAAALGVLALMIVTGARAESALAASADRRSAGQFIQFGIVAIAVVVLVRTGVIDALLAYGVWKAAFVIVGASAVARAASLAFVLMRPAAPERAGPSTGGNILQWIAIVGLAIGIVAVLPFHGIGAAVAGIAAAAGAAALVSALMPRDEAAPSGEFTATSELISEIAFLVAVLAFASH
jgi:adenosylcobinamide-GDP ribazoletransferase